MKKPLIVALVLAIAVSIVAAVWWQRRERPPADALVLHGNVDLRQVSLAFDGSGRVAEMLVEEGNRVRAGAVLARLDVKTLRLQAEQARAQSEVQKQSLLRLENGSRPEEVAQARSRLQAARSDAARAVQDLARLEQIASETGGRGVSAMDLDRARSSTQVARAKVAEQEDALRLVERGARKEDVAAARAQLGASIAQLNLLAHQIELGELKAPADGVVRSRLLEPGDMATPQRPAYALALMQPKWVRVYVGEPDLGRVRPGMPARVWTDSAPDRPLPGQVGAISSSAEFTPKSVQTEELRTSLVYEVRVRVDDPGDVLRLGQPASVRLDTGAPR